MRFVTGRFWGALAVVAIASSWASADAPLSPRASWSGKVGFFSSGVPLAISTDGDRDVDTFSQPGSIVVSPADIPSGAQLVQAFVYWGGSVNGTNCAGYTIDRDADVIPPGWTGAPVRVVADRCECSVGARSYDMQACAADVTTMALAAGVSMVGSWSVSGFIAKVTNGPTDSASASIVLVYRAPTLRPRRIALYDGLLQMSSNSTTVRLDGLKIDQPPRGDLTWYVLEGDPVRGSTERVSARGLPGGLSVVLSDAVNPADDPMNGTINTVTPPLTGLGGVDIDRLALDAALTADDASVEVTYTADQDKWWLAYNVVGVDVFASELGARSTFGFTLLDDPDGNGVPSPGDVVRYTARLQNDGTGAGSILLTGSLPSAFAGWSVSDRGGGVDESFASTLRLRAVPVPVGTFTDVSFDAYLADVPDRTVVDQAVAFDGRPNGDVGTLAAPSLVLRRDGDRDGRFDLEDNCPTVSNRDQSDLDRDGLGDACDRCPIDATNDADGDGTCENVDDCPGLANADQLDADHDAKGDACDACPADPTDDADRDGVCQNADSCPAVANPGQEDQDLDGLGDACDPCLREPRNDADGDGLCEDLDVCPGVPDPAQIDTDADGRGDACDPCTRDPANDEDDDGICGDVDLCPRAADTDQADRDGDGTGDACDACPDDKDDDFDRDGFCADRDDCPTQFDPDQADRDQDGLGDACDRCPEDPTNTLDDAQRCANEHLEKLKEDKGCGCGSSGPEGAFALLLLAGLLARRRSRAARLAVLAVAIAGVVAACAGGDSKPAPTVVSVEVLPAAAAVPVGRSQAFTAKASWSDGTVEDVTATGTWSVSGEAAQLNGPIATGAAVGAVEVSITYQGATGKAALEVTRALAVSLVISPPSATIPLGGDQAFTASAKFTDGTEREVTLDAEWTSGDASVLTPDSTRPGRFLSARVGRASVTARLDEARGAAKVEVVPATLSSLEVAPAAVSLPLGLSQALQATGRYSDGTTRDLTKLAAWSTSDASIVEVSNSPAFTGQVTARAVGAATVTASVGDAKGGCAIEATAAVPEALWVAPVTVSAALGREVSITASARFSDGAVRDVTNQATWSVADPGVVQLVSPGVVRMTAVGSTVVTAALNGLSAPVAADALAAEYERLSILPATASLPKGRSLPLTATAHYSDGSSLEVTARAVWSSSDPVRAPLTLVAGVPTLGAVQDGEVTIQARWNGRDGAAQVRVGPAVLDRIGLTPPSTSLRAGLEVQLAATGLWSDGSTTPLPDAAWSVDAPSRASVTGGLVVALAGGTATVSAARDGVVGTAQVVVDPATLDELRVEPASATVPLGLGRDLAATGVYSDGVVVPFTSLAAWATSDPAIWSLSGSGSQVSGLARAVGLAEVSATRLGITGRATIEVVPAAVVSLTLSSASVRLEAGASSSLTVEALYTDGTRRDLTAEVAWNSSDPAVASIGSGTSDAGRITAIGFGQCTISATSGAVSASASVEVLPRIPSAIELEPAALAIRVGESAPLKAFARYPDGSRDDVTAYAAWSSSTSSVSVKDGVVKGQSVGAASVTATLHGVSGSVDVSVARALVQSLTISPAAVSVPRGSTQPLQAMATLQDGSSAELTAEAAWATSDGAVATVSAGLVTAVAEGLATVSATVDGVTANASVTVPCTQRPVINELMTGLSGNAGAEFVELVNRCPLPIDLSGWKLAYRAVTNTNPIAASGDGTSTTLPAGKTLPANGRVVLATATWAGLNPTVPVLATISGGFSSSGGAVGLRDATGALVDSVGWGSATASNAFVEKASVPAPGDVAAPGKTIVRMPDGTDTDENAADFAASVKPTPGGVNALQ